MLGTLFCMSAPAHGSLQSRATDGDVSRVTRAVTEGVQIHTAMLDRLLHLSRLSPGWRRKLTL